jgi:hypothetical protein
MITQSTGLFQRRRDARMNQLHRPKMIRCRVNVCLGFRSFSLGLLDLEDGETQFLARRRERGISHGLQNDEVPL